MKKLITFILILSSLITSAQTFIPRQYVAGEKVTFNSHNWLVLKNVNAKTAPKGTTTYFKDLGVLDIPSPIDSLKVRLDALEKRPAGTNDQSGLISRIDLIERKVWELMTIKDRLTNMGFFEGREINTANTSIEGEGLSKRITDLEEIIRSAETIIIKNSGKLKIDQANKTITW